MKEVIRLADGKGRICLPGFSNAVVIVEKLGENDYRVRKGKVIPADKPCSPDEGGDEGEQVERATGHGAATEKAPLGEEPIDVIIECLKGASEDKPMTQDAIRKVLIAKFPDHKRKTLTKIVQNLVYFARENRGVEVSRRQVDGRRKGYWLID